MLGFITSLRHPLNSNDYSRVEQLLAASLASWTGQEHDDWFVVVVGNQTPSFTLPDGVVFLPVDFPAPSNLAGAATGREAVLVDKGSKLAYGLSRARVLWPQMTHFMFVDADDLVSNRLAGMVAAEPMADGWFVDQGYIYDAKRRAVQPVASGLQDMCGSTFIVREDLYPSAVLAEGLSQAEVMEAFGSEVVRMAFGSHLQVAETVAAQGGRLVPLAFPGVLYRVGTGENHSTIFMAEKALPVSGSVAGEFGVKATGLLPWRIVAAVAPPSVMMAHGRHRLRQLRHLLRR